MCGTTNPSAVKLTSKVSAVVQYLQTNDS